MDECYHQCSMYSLCFFFTLFDCCQYCFWLLLILLTPSLSNLYHFCSFLTPSLSASQELKVLLLKKPSNSILFVLKAILLLVWIKSIGRRAGDVLIVAIDIGLGVVVNFVRLGFGVV